LSFFVVSSAVWVGNSLKISKVSKRELAVSRQFAGSKGAIPESEIDRLVKQAKAFTAKPDDSLVAANSVFSAERGAAPVQRAAKIAPPIVETAIVVEKTPFVINDSVDKEPAAKDPAWLNNSFREGESASAMVSDGQLSNQPDTRLRKAESKLTFKFEEISEAVAQTKPVKKVKLAKITPAKIDDLAQYNRLLAGYFARKNAATTDGAATGGLVSEPASYEEWLAAGKPDL